VASERSRGNPQYFGISAAIERVKQYDLGNVRKGGVIWHTQGSGKSLTMVMLGRCPRARQGHRKSPHHHCDGPR